MSDFFFTEQDEANALAAVALDAELGGEPEPRRSRGGLLSALAAPAASIDSTLEDVTADVPRAFRRGVSIARTGALRGIRDLRRGEAREANLYGRLAGVDLRAQEIDQDKDWFDKWLTQQIEEERGIQRIEGPQPADLSMSAQIVGSVAEVLTAGTLSALGGPTAPAILGEGYFDVGKQRALEEGMSEETAQGVGMREGVTMGGLALLPVALPGKIWQRAMTGAGINVVGGGASRFEINRYLTERGETEAADRYQWLDPQALATDAILGAFFGAAFGGRGTPRTRVETEAGVEPPSIETLTPDQWLDRARQFGNDEDFAEAYAHALIAKDLGAAEADGVLAFIEEDADAATLSAGRARASEMAQSLVAQAADPDLGAAALLEADSIHRDIRSAPGIPADSAAARAHSNAMRRAEEQAANDEPIDVTGSGVEDARYIPHPTAADAARQRAESAYGDLTDALAARRANPTPETESAVIKAQTRFEEAERNLFEAEQRPEADIAALYREAVQSGQIPRDPEIESMLGLAEDEQGGLMFSRGAAPTEDAAAVIVDNTAPWSRRRAAAEAFTARANKAEMEALAREMWPGARISGKAQAEQAIYARLSQGERDAMMAVQISLLPRFRPGTPEMRAWIAEHPDDMARIRQEAAKRFMRVDDEGAVSSMPEDPQFSRGDLRGGASPEVIKQALISSFGADAQRLLDSAKTEVVATTGELGARTGRPIPADAKGAYDPKTGKSYIVAENVRPEEAAAILLHEVGVHTGMKDMLGPKLYAQLGRELEALAEAKNGVVLEAKEYVDDLVARGLMSKADQAEEVLAYTVERAPDLPLVRRLLAQVRQWLWRVTNGAAWVGRLTLDDIRALAVTSLRRQAKQKARPRGDGELMFGDPTGRELDRTGFASIALEGAKALPSRAMKGEEAINRLLKARGVSGFTGRVKDEIDFLGLREEFGNKKSVTRDEIIDYIRAHRLVLDEAFNRFDPRAQTRREPMTLEEYTDPRNRDAIEQADYEEELFDVLGPEDMGLNLAAPRTAEQIRSFQDAGIRRGPGDLRLPGDEPVFELRLKIPQPDKEGFEAFKREMALKHGVEDGAWQRMSEAERKRWQELERGAQPMPGSDFQSHWSRPPSNDLGVLVSVRGEERVDDKGQRTLFGGEVQSDLAQQVRRSLSEFAAQQQAIAEDTTTAPAGWGVAGDVGAQPDRAVAAERAKQAFRQMQAPLASKTSQWTGAAVRAILYRAARDGFDSVSFPTGETSEAIQGNASAAEHYETNVKGALEKVARAFGGEVRRGGVEFGTELMLRAKQGSLVNQLRDAISGQKLEEFNAALDRILRTSEQRVKVLRDANLFKRALTNNWVGDFDNLEEIKAAIDGLARGKNTASAYVLNITPEMRSRIVKEGLPLFSRDFDESERVRRAAQNAGEAMRGIGRAELERGAPDDARRQFSTGRRDTPEQVPDPGTPEYDAMLQAALAKTHPQRTEVERALVKWHREQEGPKFSLGEFAPLVWYRGSPVGEINPKTGDMWLSESRGFTRAFGGEGRAASNITPRPTTFGIQTRGRFFDPNKPADIALAREKFPPELAKRFDLPWADRNVDLWEKLDRPEIRAILKAEGYAGFDAIEDSVQTRLVFRDDDGGFSNIQEARDTMRFSIGKRDNDPVKQAIADEPDLTIPGPLGRDTKAADALAAADDAIKVAREMGAGFKAAASCAAQHGIDPIMRASTSIAAGHGLGGALGIPAGYGVSMLATADERRQREPEYRREQGRAAVRGLSNDERFPVVESAGPVAFPESGRLPDDIEEQIGYNVNPATGKPLNAPADAPNVGGPEMDEDY